MSSTPTAGDPIAPSASPLHEPKRGTRWRSVRATFAGGICLAGSFTSITDSPRDRIRVSDPHGLEPAGTILSGLSELPGLLPRRPRQSSRDPWGRGGFGPTASTLWAVQRPLACRLYPSAFALARRDRAIRRFATATTAASTIRPFTTATPEPDAAARSRASTTDSAHCVSSSRGWKAALMAATCRGWIANLPVNPRIRALAAWAAVNSKLRGSSAGESRASRRAAAQANTR